MPKLKRKLEVFRDSVLKESSEEARRIIDGLRAKQEADLMALEHELYEETQKYIASRKAEISAREGRRVSAHRSGNRQALLRYREDCAYEIFSAVHEHIREFAASPEYPEHMAGLLRRAVDQLGYGFAGDVGLRPEDMGLRKKLLGSVSGVSLRFVEAQFELGGLRLVCPSRGLRVDLSFDSAIADLVGHYSEMSGMTV